MIKYDIEVYADLICKDYQYKGICLLGEGIIIIEYSEPDGTRYHYKGTYADNNDYYIQFDSDDNDAYDLWLLKRPKQDEDDDSEPIEYVGEFYKNDADQGFWKVVVLPNIE